MRLRIQVGSVMIDWSGADVTARQVKDLIDLCAEKAADVPAEPTEPERPPIGFAAPVLDKADALPVESYFTDD